MKSLRTEFLQHSIDYLRLLSYKAQKAKNNKTIDDEFSILEFYHDGVEAIIKKYDEQIHLLNLERVNSEVHQKIIEKELEKLMGDLFKVSQKNEPKRNPSSRELELIEKKHQTGIPMNQILEHFNLTDNQILKILQNGR